MPRVPKRRLRTVIVLLAVAVAMGVVGVVAISIEGRPDPLPWNKPAAVDGATVRLTYYGSRCRDRADVDVDESSTRVVVTVKEAVRARTCDAVAIRYDVDVTLDAPLANRELVDGACRLPRFANVSECAPDVATVQ